MKRKASKGTKSLFHISDFIYGVNSGARITFQALSILLTG